MTAFVSIKRPPELAEVMIIPNGAGNGFQGSHMLGGKFYRCLLRIGGLQG